jgi:ubiquinone/menaquinone biosynthesis C-methylase UbiE
MSKAPHSLFARIYDLLMVPQDRFGLGYQRSRLCESASGRVLEIAIGTGLNIPHYSQANSVVGVDNHRGMLHRAIRRTWESPIPIHLVAADARNLPFPDDNFDTLVVGFSLCTIPDPEQTLEELARVTAPGGQLHFLEHVRSARLRWSKVQDGLAPAWAKLSGGCRPNQDTNALLHQSSWNIEELWISDGGGLIQGTAAKP